MTYDDDAHETLAKMIHRAVYVMPMTATLGLRGIYTLTWDEVCTYMPLDAERYRMAADTAFVALGRKLPPKRAKALNEARKLSKRRRKTHASG